MNELALLLKLCLLLVLPLVTGCSMAQNSKQQQPDLPYLLFQKTPCFGICPSYEATIAENGSIRFVGWEHVPVKDTVAFKFTPEEMKDLRQEVDQLEIQQLQDTYLTQWSDMPSTITTFYQNGKEIKRVKHQEAGPQRLVDFQEKLHQQIMVLVEEEARRRLPVK